MKHLLWILSICMTPCLVIASDKPATIGEQSEIMAEIEKELAQVNQQHLEYWAELPERKQTLIRITVQAIDSFKQANNRLPNTKDRAFIRQVYEQANVQNDHESLLIFQQMDSQIRPSSN